MATITEDYVSFETAKLLKEKGIDQNCATYYLDGQVWRHYHGEVIPRGKEIYAAPTQTVAMKWLREVHHIHIVIKSVIRTYGDTEYYYELYGTKNKSLCISCDIYKGESWNSNEQACEAAIKYSLINLI